MVEFSALTWTAAWKEISFRKNLLASIILLVFVLAGFFFVLEYAEARDGIVIEKGLLDGVVSPSDFSGVIFGFTYAATVAGLFFCSRRPFLALLLIRTYLLLQLFRALTLLVFPLDPPEGIIPLDDPFLRSTFYNGRPNLKDLFFSGHVATLVMFVFIVPQKWVKILLVIAAVVAGVLLALQRAHYVVDVIAAPLFAFGAFVVARWWMSLMRVSTSSSS